MKYILLAQIVSSILCAVGFEVANAQVDVASEKPLLPAGPLLKKTANFSKWQIAYKYGGDGQKSAEGQGVPLQAKVPNYRIRRVAVIRTGDVKLVNIVDESGNVTELWFSKGKSYMSTASEGVGEIPTGLEFRIGTYGSTDFPDMTFVSPENYVGMQSLGPAQCMVFSKNGTSAWISMETRYPIAWQRENETRLFQELPAPTALQVVPSEFEKFDKELKKRDDYLNRPTVRGG